MPEPILFFMDAETLLMVGGAMTALPVVSGLLKLVSERVRSQSDLDRIISEEAPKLGFEPNRIWGEYHLHQVVRIARAGLDMETGDVLAPSYIDGDTVYEIGLLDVGGPFITRKFVRHELYHLFKHAGPTNEVEPSNRLHWIVQEVSADLYANTGIKI